MKFQREMLTLYAVTDRTWLNGRTLAEVVEQAIRGGPWCSCAKRTRRPMRS